MSYLYLLVLRKEKFELGSHLVRVLQCCLLWNPIRKRLRYVMNVLPHQTSSNVNKGNNTKLAKMEMPKLTTSLNVQANGTYFYNIFPPFTLVFFLLGLRMPAWFTVCVKYIVSASREPSFGVWIQCGGGQWLEMPFYFLVCFFQSVSSLASYIT